MFDLSLQLYVLVFGIALGNVTAMQRKIALEYAMGMLRKTAQESAMVRFSFQILIAFLLFYNFLLSIYIYLLTNIF